MNAKELRPCPFCGMAVEWKETGHSGFGVYHPPTTFCILVGENTGLFATPNPERWNARSAETMLESRLAESQKECERHREIELAAHNEIVKLHTECEKIEQMITFYLLDTDELTYINSEQVLTHAATKIKSLTAEVETLGQAIKELMRLVRTWCSMGAEGGMEEEIWKLYQQSSVMKRIYGLLKNGELPEPMQGGQRDPEEFYKNNPPMRRHINIDRKIIDFEGEYLTVSKIRELAGSPEHYAVFLMIHGTEPDWRLDAPIEMERIYIEQLEQQLHQSPLFFYTTALEMTGG